MQYRKSTVLVALTAIAIATAPTLGLINKTITPRDLFAAAGQIAVLQAEKPKDKRLGFNVSEMIKGQKLPEDAATIDLTDTPDTVLEDLTAIFEGKAKVPAVLMTNREIGEAGDKEPTAYLLVGTTWFALYPEKGKWRLDKDPQDYSAVWAGGAETFALAAKALKVNRTLDFPVDANLHWSGDVKVGVAKGANGAMAVDLGDKAGRGVLVLADGGDHFIKRGAKANPTDVTASLKLTTKSKLATVGHFSGSGRIDIASYDGTQLSLAVQNEDGTFDVKPTGVSIGDAVSLATIDCGDAKRAGIVIGTKTSLVVLIPDSQAGWQQRELKGMGGPAVVADFSGAGVQEIQQYNAKGVIRLTLDKVSKVQDVALLGTPRVVLNGDFDGDGRLDSAVSGEGGTTLLQGDNEAFVVDRTVASAELAYHGNQNSPKVASSVLWDVNNDGRQGLANFYEGTPPATFFNRGFACFGFARELVLEEGLKNARDQLVQGVRAGVIDDLNGDGLPDMFAVDKSGTMWLLTAKAGQGRPTQSIELALPASAHGPITVTATAVNEKRSLGMWVVRPGQPVMIGRRTKGPVKLEWFDAKAKQRVAIDANAEKGERFELVAK